jgi:SAM-dependent methyltransferase
MGIRPNSTWWKRGSENLDTSDNAQIVVPSPVHLESSLRNLTVGTVTKWGDQRLNPSLTDPSWLVLRRRRAIIAKWISNSSPRMLDVLDVGGRIQPYRSLMTGRIRSYVAIDLQWTPLVGIIAKAEQIPLPSERFDLVLCTQVLEYVPQPAAAIAEFLRVLKPGASLILTAPSVGLQDHAEEYWRFLPPALAGLLGGFRESEICPEGSSVVGFFRMMNGCVDVFARRPWLRTCFRWTLCPVLNIVGELLDRVSGTRNTQFTTNYCVWARK